MSTHDLESRQSAQAWHALAAVQDDPQVKQWLAESDARARRQPGRRLYWAAAASIFVVVGAASVATYLYMDTENLTTGVGEQRDVLLDDGSRITLNTNTTLVVHYSSSERRIELQRGEALFSVKQDRKRPFEVVAGDTVTRALGTEFNVDLRQDKVTVSVIDGAVRVSAKNENKSATLAGGQAVQFVAKKLAAQPQQADLKRIDGWRTRRLEFGDTPLAQAVEEFNRYSKTRVVIGTPGLESVRVSGVFRIGDIDGFLYSLREALGVETHESAGEVVLMR